MWARKIRVKTGTSFPKDLSEEFVDQITKDLTMYITPFTTNKRMLRRAGAACKCDDNSEDLIDRFQITVDGSFYRLDYSGNLSRLIRFLGNPEVIYLEYVIGLPGGLGIEEENGIHYFLHTKELRHVPHVHARYQGEEISIEILTSKVRGSFKNHKKQKEAIEHVRNKKERFLSEYNLKTNGIHLSTEYVDNGKFTTLMK